MKKAQVGNLPLWLIAVIVLAVSLIILGIVNVAFGEQYNIFSGFFKKISFLW